MELDLDHSAVMGLHWQRNVVKPEGFFGAWFADPVAGSGVIERTARVIAAARDAGIPVVYTRFVVPSDDGQLVRNTPVMAQVAESEQFRPESPTVAIIDELAPGDGDWVIDNQKLSGLAGSDLPDRLRSAGVGTLVLTGVATNLTVESTARHGIDLGFRVYVLRDCVAAAAPAVHDASIANLEMATTGVIGSDEWFAALASRRR